MVGAIVSSADAALAADGTSSGRVVVADVSPFVLGAIVVLSSSAGRSAYRIANIDPDSNTLGLRPLLPGEPSEEQINAALPTVANYTTADGARISQAEQFVEGASPPAEGNEP